MGQHHFWDPPDDRRLTHLLFFNVGSHRSGGEALFRSRLERLSQTVERMGLPFVPVNSNLDLFYEEGYGFAQTLTVRNVAACLLLQRGIGRYFPASGHSAQNQRLTESRSMAATDLFLLPALCTNAFGAISTGSEYTRVAKTALVTSIRDAYNSLSVCTKHDDPENCSSCSKCLRTMLTLEILGVLERYESTFDLEIYRKHRAWYIARVLSCESSYDAEINELIAERDFKLPLTSRLYIHLRILHLQRLGRRIARRVKRITRLTRP